ncbi:MFS transporter [Pseudoalteromonas sp. GCY]|uniref:MFS transporter n=1 Tax=Pseudoalteromonas sp. GCY TaxID=2003316 RepID=UPI000BFF0D63|nr:MFS transporter [Pseudoalteromonas sp. GCY]PHI38381.1 MFS transporter [Pseudoalteromonas sp. GCY]QQQ65695.1 MFS transporter [Pseudoalteromonas sp. GCY]
MSKISENIYQKLTNDDEARACKAIDDKACKEVPGNYVLILLSQLLSALGDALLNPKITLPWLMQSLGAPAYMISALVPIRESGSLIPQLFIGQWVRKHAKRKHLWSLGTLIQAICVLLMALLAWQQTENQLYAWLVLGLLAIFSIARSLSSVSSKDVIGKTIPKQKRGQLSGQAASVSGLITVTFGVGLFIAATQVNNVNFVITLVLAAIFWLVGALTFSKINEYEGATEGGESGLARIKQDFALLKTDPTLKKFIFARGLLLSSALIPPYFTVMAQQNIGGGAWVLAILLAVSGLASLVSGAFWGRLADQSSKRVMIYGATITVLITAVLLTISLFYSSLLEKMWFIPLCYFVIAIAHQGVRVGRKTYVIDMAEGNKRTSYVTLSNTIIGIILLLTSGLGVVASVFSINVLLALYIMITILGIVMTSRLPNVTER